MYDNTAEAPYFNILNFSESQNFYRLNITNSLNLTRINTPGLLIHDQVKINHDTSYQRLYNVPYVGMSESNLLNSQYWLIYSESKLSYKEIAEQIEGSDFNSPLPAINSKWALFDPVNKKQYNKDYIPPDGEINNNIIMFKKGIPSNMTYSVKWTPIPIEKGKKVFKFSFLFTDPEYNRFNFQ